MHAEKKERRVAKKKKKKTAQKLLQISFVQSLSHVWLFATPWTAAHQASLSFTISRSLHKVMSTELMMPSNHLIILRSFELEQSQKEWAGVRF